MRKTGKTPHSLQKLRILQRRGIY